LGQDSSQESPPIRVYPELTTLLREHAAGAIAGEDQAGVAIHAFPATCRALRAIAGHLCLCPLQEKPFPQAGDVLVAIPLGSHKNRHESEEAARRDAALDVAAREIPAVGEPDEGGAVAGQAAKPSRKLRRLRALPEEEQLLVGSAEEEWRGDGRDVERRRRAAGGERQVDVHHMQGSVLGEDALHPIRLVDGAAQEHAAAVAPELESWRPARRPAGLLHPERVGDAQLPACLRPAA